jgi:hypothetical protein
MVCNPLFISVPDAADAFTKYGSNGETRIKRRPCVESKLGKHVKIFYPSGITTRRSCITALSHHSPKPELAQANWVTWGQLADFRSGVTANHVSSVPSPLPSICRTDESPAYTYSGWPSYSTCLPSGPST